MIYEYMNIFSYIHIKEQTLWPFLISRSHNSSIPQSLNLTIPQFLHSSISQSHNSSISHLSIPPSLNLTISQFLNPSIPPSLTLTIPHSHNSSISQFSHLSIPIHTKRGSTHTCPYRTPKNTHLQSSITLLKPFQRIPAPIVHQNTPYF